MTNTVYLHLGKQPRQRAPGVGDEVRRHAQRIPARSRELVLEAPERILDRRREPARAGSFGKGTLCPRLDRAVREVDVDPIGRELAPNLRQRRRGPGRGQDAREVIRCQRLCGINQCVGCTRQFFTKSFLGDDAAVLARSSG